MPDVAPSPSLRCRLELSRCRRRREGGREEVRKAALESSFSSPFFFFFFLLSRFRFAGAAAPDHLSAGQSRACKVRPCQRRSISVGIPRAQTLFPQPRPKLHFRSRRERGGEKTAGACGVCMPGALDSAAASVASVRRVVAAPNRVVVTSGKSVTTPQLLSAISLLSNSRKSEEVSANLCRVRSLAPFLRRSPFFTIIEAERRKEGRKEGGGGRGEDRSHGARIHTQEPLHRVAHLLARSPCTT